MHEAQVNYIGLGPFRFTKTKKNLSPILGLKGYQSILQQYKMANLSLPIIAIGGITLDDVAILKANHLYGIAISSLINLAENPVEVTQALRELLS